METQDRVNKCAAQRTEKPEILTSGGHSHDNSSLPLPSISLKLRKFTLTTLKKNIPFYLLYRLTNINIYIYEEYHFVNMIPSYPSLLSPFQSMAVQQAGPPCCHSFSTLGVCILCQPHMTTGREVLLTHTFKQAHVGGKLAAECAWTRASQLLSGSIGAWRQRVAVDCITCICVVQTVSSDE